MAAKKRAKAELKPCFIIHQDGADCFYVKHPTLKGHYIPLTPEQQAQYTPDKLPLEVELNRIDLDKVQQREQEKKRKEVKKRMKKTKKKKGGKGYRSEKKAKRQYFQKACHKLITAPDMLSDPAPAWTILLICLLALVMDLAVRTLTGAPVLRLKDAGNTLSEALMGLLRITHGPTVIKGKGVWLKFPCCIRAVTPFNAAAPSAQPEDYFGGYVKIGQKRMSCWLPLRNRAVFVAPNVPQAAWNNVLAQSHLAVPIFCTTVPKWPNRTVLTVDGTAFQSVDLDMLKKLKKQREPVYAALKTFEYWLHHKKRRWKQCIKDMSNFIPTVRNGRFTSTVTSDETCVIALALAIYKNCLGFAVKEKWVTPETANESLSKAWQQVLPESYPKSDTGSSVDTPVVSGKWDEPTVFWIFLNRYLQECQQHISLDGAPCKRGTTAVVHELTSETYLVCPREQVAQAYAEHLRANGIPLPEDKNWETTLQRSILNWGIQVKTEKDDITWRFNFYKKDAVEKSKVPCLAFPLIQLPETITKNLSDWFGEAFGRWLPPQVARSEAELEKVQELTKDE